MNRYSLRDLLCAVPPSIVGGSIAVCTIPSLRTFTYFWEDGTAIQLKISNPLWSARSSSSIWREGWAKALECFVKEPVLGWRHFFLSGKRGFLWLGASRGRGVEAWPTSWRTEGSLWSLWALKPEHKVGCPLKWALIPSFVLGTQSCPV